MKKDKQLKLLQILKTDRYKVLEDNILRKVQSTGEYVQLKGVVLPTGYEQLRLYNGKRGDGGINVIVYKHVIIYLFHNGIYDDGMEIDHIDRNNKNNNINNLRCIVPQQTKVGEGGGNAGEIRTIRGGEIAAIRERLFAGETNMSRLARTLNLNRISVMYVVGKIKKGLPLKYE